MVKWRKYKSPFDETGETSLSSYIKTNLNEVLILKLFSFKPDRETQAEAASKRGYSGVFVSVVLEP